MKKLSPTIGEMPETKRKLLDAGIMLMRERGFNGTSVADICAAAGTTKGGFFHYFATKEDLTKEAAALFREERVQAYKAAGFLDLPDPLDRILGRLEFFKSSERTQYAHSCLIGTLAQEISTTHPSLRAIFQNTFAHMSHALEVDLAAAKAVHAPDAPFDPAALASMFVATYQGAIMMSKAAEDTAVVVASIDGFISCLKSFFPKAIPRPKARPVKAKTAR